MRTELTAGVVILSAALLVWWRHRRHRSIHASSLPLPSLPLLSRGSRDRAAGRFYIVSGGAQGCGEAIARLLAIEGAAGLTLCDRETTKGSATAAAIEAETGCRTIFMHTELGDIASCAHALDAHDAAFKRLDGLINAAATTRRGNWDDTSADLFDTVYAINVRAPFLLMQGAARLMRRDGLRGSVVNIGSVHCHGGMPKLVAYASSKAALLNLTRNFAFAQRKYGIRANYVALGWTATPTEHSTMLAEGLPEDWLSSVADASHPLGRILRPADVAKLVVHLLSDDAELHTGDCIDLHERFNGTWE